ncbi:MAG: glucose 1-dehydrogenase [Phycisphaeraceae bacterium]|nr:glucose 1-dehydrogenase [Phycisphaeraceae bacterium]
MSSTSPEQVFDLAASAWPASPLSGRVALVTGGGAGIGRATVWAMLAVGAKVMVAERDEDAAAEVVQRGKELGEVEHVPCDVASAGDIERAVDQCAQRFGGLDILVNNVGIGRTRPLAELDLATWNQVMATNLTAMMLAARRAAPLLEKTGTGSIVNIASTRALMSEPNTEAYSASKGGVVALTHALAASLAPKVRVNCICPGWIETGAWQPSAKAQAAEHTEADRLQHWSGRVGDPMDIARMCIYVSSDMAGFISGQAIVIDGGMTRKMIYV